MWHSFVASQPAKFKSRVQTLLRGSPTHPRIAYISLSVVSLSILSGNIMLLGLMCSCKMNQQRNDSWHNYFLMELLACSQQARISCCCAVLQPACAWNINSGTFFSTQNKASRRKENKYLMRRRLHFAAAVFYQLKRALNSEAKKHQMHDLICARYHRLNLIAI